MPLVVYRDIGAFVGGPEGLEVPVEQEWVEVARGCGGLAD